jgi:hypothetical protein
MQTFLKELSGEARADEDWEVPAEATEGSVTPYEQD